MVTANTGKRLREGHQLHTVGPYQFGDSAANFWQRLLICRGCNFSSVIFQKRSFQNRGKAREVELLDVVVWNLPLSTVKVMSFADSCLILTPATRSQGMRIDSGMGINSTDPVSETEIPNRSSESSPMSAAGKPSKTPVHVTDDSERSHRRKRNEYIAASETMQQDTPVEATKDSRPPKRKLGGLHRSGPVLEDEQNGDAGPSSSETKVTLPQHERIQEVEPLDISYVCTPASLKLKGVLVSRLIGATTSGRIQVVSCIESKLSLRRALQAFSDCSYSFRLIYHEEG